mmetsp:Transcript_92982/g.240711  ORF Transcript_92982/g.240711 Transcript_92982/m.240711 type:complete len:297 (-) Transcript_92982:905-1795(-)
MDPIASLHHREGEHRQPHHAHGERHGIQVLLLRVVHVWDRPLNKELHRELKPLDPLHQRVHHAFRRWGLRSLAALGKELAAQSLHPCVHDSLVLRAELQGDQVAQVGVMLVDVQIEVLLVTDASLAIEDVLEGNHLPRRIAKARQLDGWRVHVPCSKRPLALGEQRVLQGVGRLLVLGAILRAEEDRLIDQTSVMPMLIIGVLVIVEANAALASLELQRLPLSHRVDHGADDQGVLLQPHVTVVDVVVPIHEPVPEIHTHTQDRACLGVLASFCSRPLCDRFWVGLVIRVRVVVVA